MQYVAVAVGGALGALFRFMLAAVLPPVWGFMPLRMMLVNIMGCLLMGILSGLMVEFWAPHPFIKTFLLPGLLGGFTTFSAFAWEYGLLYDSGHWKTACVYVVLTVCLSIMAFFVGHRLMLHIT